MTSPVAPVIACAQDAESGSGIGTFPPLPSPTRLGSPPLGRGLRKGSALIVRKPHHANFTVISREVLECTDLSYKARGLLAYLLAKPDAWEVSLSQLVKAGPDGRHSVESALDELENAGYIRRPEQAKNAQGRFLEIALEVWEEPYGWDRCPKPTTVTDVENPLTENRLPVFDNRVNTKEVNTQEQNLSALDDDPLHRAAWLLTVTAHEQVPRPVLRGGFPALLGIIKRLLDSGTSYEDIQRAITYGVTVWTTAGIQTAIAQSRPRQDLRRRHGMDRSTDRPLTEVLGNLFASRPRSLPRGES